MKLEIAAQHRTVPTRKMLKALILVLPPVRIRSFLRLQTLASNSVWAMHAVMVIHVPKMTSAPPTTPVKVSPIPAQTARAALKTNATVSVAAAFP
jgi:hypothetical protein